MNDKRFSFHTHVVISEDYYRDICDDFGFSYTFFKNNPLGEKLNAGLADCMKLDWDYMITLGSDDLISDRVLDIYYPLFEAGLDYFGLDRIGFIDSETGEAVEYPTNTIFGLGRCTSRKVIEKSALAYFVRSKETFVSDGFSMRTGEEGWANAYKVNGLKHLLEIIDGPQWKLWRDDFENGMDGSSNMNIEKNGFIHQRVHIEEPLLLDIKSQVNLGLFKYYRGGGAIKKDVGELLKYFPYEADEIWSLWQEEKMLI